MKRTIAFEDSFQGQYFVAVLDRHAGRRREYTLLMWGAGTNRARVLGREISLAMCRELVEKRRQVVTLKGPKLSAKVARQVARLGKLRPRSNCLVR